MNSKSSIEVNGQKYYIDWQAFQAEKYWKEVCLYGNHPNTKELMEEWLRTHPKSMYENIPD